MGTKTSDKAEGPMSLVASHRRCGGFSRWFWVIFDDDFHLQFCECWWPYFLGRWVKTVTLWKVKMWLTSNSGLSKGHEWKKLVEGMQFGSTFPETNSKFIPEDGWNTFAFNFCGFKKPMFQQICSFQGGYLDLLCFYKSNFIAIFGITTGPSLLN